MYKDTTTFPNLITITEAATILGVTTKTLRRWEERKLIKAIRLTPYSHRKYNREEIENLAKNGVQK